jgi:hypothetical protein
MVLVFGALGAAALVQSHRSQPKEGRGATRPRPGWIARRRARSPARHPREGWTAGYRGALATSGLSGREFLLGGLILGAPGSGKTWSACSIIQALAGRGMAGIVLDPKPSQDLAEAVRAAGGEVWTIGGELRWDALPDDPSELANQVVEVLPVTAESKVYRDAARLWLLIVGQTMQRLGEHPTVPRLVQLCRPDHLRAVLKAQHREADLPRFSSTEADGVLSCRTALAIISQGTAGLSLGRGLRLDEVVRSNKLVLFQLNAGALPEETRILGAWVLRSMLRLLRLPEPSLLLVDEFARLGVQGRAALELLSLGREFKKPVVLCSQGPSDLDELSQHALAEAAQNAAWLLAFRQGTRDSVEASRLLGTRLAEDRIWSSTGRDTVRLVEKPFALPSELEALVPGEAFLRVPPIERQRVRVERLRVAVPSVSRVVPSFAETQGGSLRNDGITSPPPPDQPAAVVPALVTLPSQSADADLAKVRRQLERKPNGCLIWTGSVYSNNGRPRVWIKSEGRSRIVYVWLWKRERGEIPSGWTLHHFKCQDIRCCELAHLEPRTRGDNAAERFPESI